jgi:hypothetical protein
MLNSNPLLTEAIAEMSDVQAINTLIFNIASWAGTLRVAEQLNLQPAVYSPNSCYHKIEAQLMKSLSLLGDLAIRSHIPVTENAFWRLIDSRWHALYTEKHEETRIVSTEFLTYEEFEHCISANNTIDSNDHLLITNGEELFKDPSTKGGWGAMWLLINTVSGTEHALGILDKETAHNIYTQIFGIA